MRCDLQAEAMPLMAVQDVIADLARSVGLAPVPDDRPLRARLLMRPRRRRARFDYKF
jgi:hypothetical protein